MVLITWQLVEAWRKVRSDRVLFGLSVAALPLVLSQAVLGGIVVHTDLDPAWVTVHFAFAMALIAVVVTLAVEARYRTSPPAEVGPGPRGRRVRPARGGDGDRRVRDAAGRARTSARPAPGSRSATGR